jgi:hypothetical protein
MAIGDPGENVGHNQRVTAQPWIKQGWGRRQGNAIRHSRRSFATTKCGA